MTRLLALLLLPSCLGNYDESLMHPTPVYAVCGGVEDGADAGVEEDGR
jgi:hypothetical protein